VLELLNSKVDHPDYQADRTAWGVHVCDLVGSPRVKLLYDIYHMQIMEGDIIRTIRDNAVYIGHYHTAGNPGRHELEARMMATMRTGEVASELARLVDYLRAQLAQALGSAVVEGLLGGALALFSPALQVVAQEASIHGFGSILLGAIVLARASAALHLAWDPARAAYLLAVLGSSVIMIGALNLATNCVAFWEPSATGTFPFLVQNVLELAKFPLTLYGRLVQLLLTWALPFVFVSYYPGLVLLGKPSPVPALGVLAPLSGPAVAIVASLVWRRGLARYQGAGH